MADNFTQFSTYFPTNGHSPEEPELDQEEVDWWEKTLQLYEFNGEAAEEKWPESGSLDLDWKVIENQIWFYSEGSGDPGQLCDLAQDFIKKFRPKMKFEFTWAHTCSKLRVDEFSGGRAVITKENIEYF